MKRLFPNDHTLELRLGDITAIPVEAMANAANSQLAGGGGVDGAIHRAGGPAIMKELDIIRSQSGGCATGSAVVTGAGLLPARFVLHAVGPVYRDGRHGEPELLASAYRTCLVLAASLGVQSLSFPSISTGVYGYPVAQAAPTALATVTAHWRAENHLPTTVLFVLFDRATLAAYEAALAGIAPE